MPGPWNDATDKQLLLAIIQLMSVGTPPWPEVAAAMGEGYTAESTRQHFAKLKKEGKALVDGGGSGTASPAKKTPVKRGGKKAAGEGGKSGGKRKAKVGDSEEVGEDDEESPAKKIKAAVKDEEHDDDERL